MALAPMTNRQSHEDGTIGDAELHWLVARARGGFGLVMTCASHIRRDGQGWPGELGIWGDRHIAGLAELARRIRAEGATSSVQLHHGGLRADTEIVEDRVAPWDDAETGARALTTTEIQDVVGAFGRAAARAEAAGFDGVEIHGAHGYLIGQFLDAVHNHRTDGYGGTFDGRTRFLREVLSEVRRSTGDQFQVGLRLSPERWGIPLAESKALAAEVLASDEVDYLDMSLWDAFKAPENGKKPLLEHFAELERGETRLGVAGRIRTSRRMQECLDAGADFVSIGTAAILHHDFPCRVFDDAEFEAAPEPVDAAYLAGEELGAAFIEYLREIRPNLILNPAQTEKDQS